MAPDLLGGVANVASRDVKQYAQRMVVDHHGRGGLHLRHSGGCALTARTSVARVHVESSSSSSVCFCLSAPKPCAMEGDASSMRSELALKENGGRAHIAHRDQALLGDGTKTIP